MPDSDRPDSEAGPGTPAIPADTLIRLSCLCSDVSRLFSYPQAAIPRMTTVSEAPPAALTPELQALQVEYTRLFINSLPEVPCPPYGSVYLEGSCMAASTVSVQAAYRRAGVETDEMPDHIAVEMQFLAIAFQAMAKGATGLQTDVAELVRHLVSWTPAFLDRVSKCDRIGFYAHAARFARAVVSELDQTAGMDNPSCAAGEMDGTSAVVARPQGSRRLSKDFCEPRRADRPAKMGMKRGQQV